MNYKILFFFILIYYLVNIHSSYAQNHSCSNYSECSNMAKQGDHDAEYKLATIYDLGKGIAANPKQAFAWYKLAAQSGHKLAEFRMGEYYRLGDLVEKDYHQAKNWYKLSAAKGHKVASARLWSLAKLGLIAYESEVKDIKGSGFFINPDHLVTNYHVANGCHILEIENSNFTDIGKVIAVDEANDLAIIKTNHISGHMLSLRNNPPVLQWEDVFTVGYNNKIILKSTQIIHPNIELKERVKNKYFIARKIKLKAAINAGDSGGPVIDLNGNVIGVNSSGVDIGKTSTEAKLSYDLAINLSHLKALLNKHQISYKRGDNLVVLPKEKLVKQIDKSIIEIICVHN